MKATEEAVKEIASLKFGGKSDSRASEVDARGAVAIALARQGWFAEAAAQLELAEKAACGDLFVWFSTASRPLGRDL